MRVKLSGWKGRREILAFVRWLEAIIEVRHDLELVRCPPPLYGYFEAPRLTADCPRMIVVDDSGVLVTIAHEFVHYEQWRDKRDVNERGVEQRARALVRRWRRERK